MFVRKTKMETPIQRSTPLSEINWNFTKRLDPFLEGLSRYYFRCVLTGWENIPTEGQVLIVGNHNGLLTFDPLMIVHAWWKRYGPSRKILGLAHRVALDNPLFSWWTIPADPTVAFEAFTRGYSLFVCPGGQKEAFRSYRERKQIDFYQRKGFIRLALKANVPIVPVVSIGAHESYVILHRGEKIAEALGWKNKFRMHGIPITLGMVFFLGCLVLGIVGVFPLLLVAAAFISIFIPMPAKMKFKILSPVSVRSMMDPNLTEEQNLQNIYDHIVNQMQSVLTEEYAKRTFPVIG